MLILSIKILSTKCSLQAVAEERLVCTSLAWPDVPGKGTSGHYCQHSVIQWNFIGVTSRHSVIARKCNCKASSRWCKWQTNDYHQGLGRTVAPKHIERKSEEALH